VSRYIVTVAFAALLVGWTVSLVVLQVTNDPDPAPVVNVIEQPATACEQFEQASAFLTQDGQSGDSARLILTAAGEAMGVPADSAPASALSGPASEAVHRHGRLFQKCVDGANASP
jgi:hypothetical protein